MQTNTSEELMAIINPEDFDRQLELPAKAPASTCKPGTVYLSPRGVPMTCIGPTEPNPNDATDIQGMQFKDGSGQVHTFPMSVWVQEVPNAVPTPVSEAKTTVDLLVGAKRGLVEAQIGNLSIDEVMRLAERDSRMWLQALVSMEMDRRGYDHESAEPSPPSPPDDSTTTATTTKDVTPTPTPTPPPADPDPKDVTPDPRQGSSMPVPPSFFDSDGVTLDRDGSPNGYFKDTDQGRVYSNPDHEPSDAGDGDGPPPENVLRCKFKTTSRIGVCGLRATHKEEPGPHEGIPYCQHHMPRMNESDRTDTRIPAHLMGDGAPDTDLGGSTAEGAAPLGQQPEPPGSSANEPGGSGIPEPTTTATDTDGDTGGPILHWGLSTAPGRAACGFAWAKENGNAIIPLTDADRRRVTCADCKRAAVSLNTTAGVSEGPNSFELVLEAYEAFVRKLETHPRNGDRIAIVKDCDDAAILQGVAAEQSGVDVQTSVRREIERQISWLEKIQAAAKDVTRLQQYRVSKYVTARPGVLRRVHALLGIEEAEDLVVVDDPYVAPPSPVDDPRIKRLAERLMPDRAIRTEKREGKWHAWVDGNESLSGIGNNTAQAIVQLADALKMTAAQEVVEAQGIKWRQSEPDERPHPEPDPEPRVHEDDTKNYHLTRSEVGELFDLSGLRMDRHSMGEVLEEFKKMAIRDTERQAIDPRETLAIAIDSLAQLGNELILGEMVRRIRSMRVQGYSIELRITTTDDG